MEKVFNAFLYYQDNLIREIGYVCHKLTGCDEEIRHRLQKAIVQDHLNAIKIRLEKPLPYEDFMAMCRLGEHRHLFEEIFQKEQASSEPFLLITPIIDGRPYFNMQANHEPFSYSEVPSVSQLYPGIMPDYLFEYLEGNRFHFDKLINDDFFEAIKLLYQNKHYISATKLLLSCIDTLSFVEYGDVSGSFQKWLNQYAALDNHNITVDELWELRNSYLHMTNLDSRKIINGTVKRTIVYIGNAHESKLEKGGTEDVKFLNLTTFVHTIAFAISAWGQTYNDVPLKMIDFIKRYDLTVSDKRMAKMEQ